MSHGSAKLVQSAFAARDPSRIFPWNWMPSMRFTCMRCPRSSWNRMRFSVGEDAASPLGSTGERYVMPRMRSTAALNDPSSAPASVAGKYSVAPRNA